MQHIKFQPPLTLQSADAGSSRYPISLKFFPPGSDCSDLFALRYRSYLSADLIEDNETASYNDRFDDLATTVAIGAYDDTGCIGSVRMSFSLDTDKIGALPCGSVYPELQGMRRGISGTIVEISRLSIDPRITNTSYRTTLYGSLVRAAFIGFEAAGASYILVASQEKNLRFYEYMLGFKVVAGPEFYPPGRVPVYLLGGNFAIAEKRRRAQNAFFRISGAEITAMQKLLAPILANSLQSDVALSASAAF